MCTELFQGFPSCSSTIKITFTDSNMEEQKNKSNANNNPSTPGGRWKLNKWERSSRVTDLTNTAGCVQKENWCVLVSNDAHRHTKKTECWQTQRLRASLKHSSEVPEIKKKKNSTGYKAYRARRGIVYIQDSCVVFVIMCWFFFSISSCSFWEIHSDQWDRELQRDWTPARRW